MASKVEKMESDEPEFYIPGPDAVDVSPNHDGGVLKTIVVPGEGDEMPCKGNKVFVHYTGKLMDGQKFDSSVDRGEMFEFTLGKGEVIKAWDIGVATMKKGEKCTLVCHPDYAYGKKGSLPKIPEDATLVFDIELIKWQMEDLSPEKDNGILRSVINEGDGHLTPNEGATVEVHLVGRCNGTMFEERDVKFQVGEGFEVGVVSGLDIAIAKFKKGEKSSITLSPKYGFGDKGNPELNVPPNSTLEYEVTLNSFEKEKESWNMTSEEKLEQSEIVKNKGTSYFKNGKFDGHCNTTCFWVIPPENNNGSVLLLDLQFLSLLKDDKISILELNSERTLIGVVNASMTHVPQVSLPSNVGAVVEINRGICEEKDNNIIVIGHSSYVPACDKIMTLNASETFVVTSPLYPDTYPLHASCRWNVSVSKDNLVHLAFQKLKLAPNHCVKVVQTVGNKTFEGSSLPDDLFLYGELSIEFNSFNCKKSQVDATLVSDEGFVINGTVADCGSVLDGKTSGEFDTNLSGNKSQCIWKVSVPSNPDDMNIISYTISKTDNKENYDLHVYDGASIREMQITNDTGAELLSRTNNLIFVYKKLDVSKPSSVLKFKYSAKGCDKTMMCENKICMHPDWKCNGVNDCGDFSDEAHCKSKPLPPEIKFTGYSAMAFWMTLIAMFVIGVILGVVGPHLYQKYKNGQYRRFADISVIE